MVVVTRQHETNDNHEQPWKTLTTQHQLDYLLEGGRLHPVVAVFCGETGKVALIRTRVILAIATIN